MNNKLLSTKNFTATLVMSMLISQSAGAAERIRAVRGNSGDSSSSSSGEGHTQVTVTPGKVVDQKINAVEGTKIGGCENDQDSDLATFFPLDFFQNISKDGSTISFSKNESTNSVTVKFPAMIKGCGTFKAEQVQDDVTKTVAISVKLDNGKTYKEYIDCLKEKKINDKSIMAADGSINMDSIPTKEFAGEYAIEMPPYKLEKKDIKKSIKLVFGSPTSFEERGKEGYPAPFGVDKDEKLSRCMRAENVEKDKISYLHKGQEVLINELKAVCARGDAQEMANARKSIGNMDALKDIADKIKSELDAGILIAKKRNVTDDIYPKMQDIEDRIMKEGTKMDEETARKEMKEYADLAEQLSKKFIDPAIARIEDLMKLASKMKESDPKRKEIDEEIKKLNADIAAFSKRRSTAFYSMYALMEKFAINDSAAAIESIRLKSYLYGKVYIGKTDENRGDKLTIDQANKKQVAGVKKFEGTLTDWSDIYLSGKGNPYPYLKTVKEHNALTAKMNANWNKYLTDEQSQGNQYCSIGMTGAVSNPLQCKTFQAGAAKRQKAALAKRQQDLVAIQTKKDKFNKIEGKIEQYSKEIARNPNGEEGGFDPNGSTYTSYEESFADRFPQYYGNLNPTTYDPAAYSMQTGALGGMGNQPMYSAQAQVPQGTFQMPQRNW